jgi:cytoskeletal protein CcmA (bactofilin family)
MRELPPQPAKPVMPVFPAPARPDPAGPAPDDSVIARDDHFEGTFTSRGTVVVMGSVKGRIEAVRVRIEDGAKVDADVIVDEAIVAGMFTGTLTCRERLEAQASGRINGRVETYRLMLHEGASIEGEMHMLSEAPKDASETIRGTAPLRGEAKADGKREAAATPGGTPPGKPVPTITPSSAAKPATNAVGTPPAPSVGPSSGPVGVPVTPAAPRAEASSAPGRSSIAETLRLETLRVVPRATTAAPRQGSPAGTGGGSGSRSRSSTTTTGF